jgi:3-hydroxyisobutyrate dehydrogenase-like beta-hydroxyacid dehydrogenase
VGKKAAAAKLVAVVAGSEEARKIALPLLEPVVVRKHFDLGKFKGARVGVALNRHGHLVGDKASKAASLKLIGNGAVFALMELVAEGTTLADKAGVGAAWFYEFVKVRTVHGTLFLF